MLYEEMSRCWAPKINFSFQLEFYCSLCARWAKCCQYTHMHTYINMYTHTHTHRCILLLAGDRANHWTMKSYCAFQQHIVIRFVVVVDWLYCYCCHFSPEACQLALRSAEVLKCCQKCGKPPAAVSSQRHMFILSLGDEESLNGQQKQQNLTKKKIQNICKNKKMKLITSNYTC